MTLRFFEEGHDDIMMIDPPIEELRKIAGNEYILTNLVAKRAKELEKEIPDVIEHSQEKAISIAAREVYSGKVVKGDMLEDDIKFGAVLVDTEGQEE